MAEITGERKTHDVPHKQGKGTGGGKRGHRIREMRIRRGGEPNEPQNGWIAQHENETMEGEPLPHTEHPIAGGPDDLGPLHDHIEQHLGEPEEGEEEQATGNRQ